MAHEREKQSARSMFLNGQLEQLFAEYDRFIESDQNIPRSEFVSTLNNTISEYREGDVPADQRENESDIFKLSDIIDSWDADSDLGGEFWRVLLGIRQRLDYAIETQKTSCKPLSIPELRKLGVSDRQICTMYGFTYRLSDGSRVADFSLLAKETEKPGSVTTAPGFEFPESRQSKEKAEQKKRYREKQLERLRIKEAALLKTRKDKQSPRVGTLEEAIAQGVSLPQLIKIFRFEGETPEAATARFQATAEKAGLEITASYVAPPIPKDAIEAVHVESPESTYQDIAERVSTPTRPVTWREVREVLKGVKKANKGTA